MTGPESSSIPAASAESKATHQTILRHLAKLRDGALAALAQLAPHGRAATAAAAAPPRVGDAARAPVPSKSPLEARIERHMATVERALTLIVQAAPADGSREGPAEEQRQAIARQERTIRGIIDAEVLFWGATTENNPTVKLDEVEAAWVRRLLRLAGDHGCSPDRVEYLRFLRTWAANAH
jgi:hypothetical protein